MFTIFRYHLSRARFTIIIWGLSLTAYGAYILTFYDTFIEQREVMEELLKQYPPEVFAFFGGMTDMFSRGGYLNVYFFYLMPLVLGIYAVLSGSGLLVADEEGGVLDLVVAHPISRTTLFFSRLAAFIVSLILIIAITWTGFILVLPNTGLDITPGELLLPFLSLFSALLFFGFLGLLLSMLLPSRSASAMLTSFLLVASFLMISLIDLNPDLEGVAQFTPLYYYQGGFALEGLEWGWFGGLIGFAILFMVLAWRLFEGRDIRVGGEGGWRLPWKRRRRIVSEVAVG
ncbi:MAG: ABC transporter permease subunit [Anaerolineales bacterium]|nr:ABC transporter permease subunit [Anaerolineales bacterium]